MEPDSGLVQVDREENGEYSFVYSVRLEHDWGDARLLSADFPAAAQRRRLTATSCEEFVFSPTAPTAAPSPCLLATTTTTTTPRPPIQRPWGTLAPSGNRRVLRSAYSSRETLPDPVTAEDLLASTAYKNAKRLAIARVIGGVNETIRDYGPNPVLITGFTVVVGGRRLSLAELEGTSPPDEEVESEDFTVEEAAIRVRGGRNDFPSEPGSSTNKNDVVPTTLLARQREFPTGVANSDPRRRLQNVEVSVTTDFEVTTDTPDQSQTVVDALSDSAVASAAVRAETNTAFLEFIDDFAADPFFAPTYFWTLPTVVTVTSVQTLIILSPAIATEAALFRYPGAKVFLPDDDASAAIRVRVGFRPANDDSRPAFSCCGEDAYHNVTVCETVQISALNEFGNETTVSDVTTCGEEALTSPNATHCTVPTGVTNQPYPWGVYARDKLVSAPVLTGPAAMKVGYHQFRLPKHLRSRGTGVVVVSRVSSVSLVAIASRP